MKGTLFFLCVLVSIPYLHAMQDQVKGPKPVEIEVLETMQQVNSLTARSHVLALHISMRKGVRHFPLFENYFHAAENNVKAVIITLSMNQDDPTRTAQLLEKLTQLNQSKDHLSPIVEKMETMVRHKIRKQALSYQAPLEDAVQGLIDHINNAPH